VYLSFSDDKYRMRWKEIAEGEIPAILKAQWSLRPIEPEPPVDDAQKPIGPAGDQEISSLLKPRRTRQADPTEQPSQAPSPPAGP